MKRHFLLLATLTAMHWTVAAAYGSDFLRSPAADAEPSAGSSLTESPGAMSARSDVTSESRWSNAEPVFPAKRLDRVLLPGVGNLRVPGEFERQQWLLFSCGELSLSYADTLAEIAQAVRRKVRVGILYADEDQRNTVDAALRQRMDSLENVRLLPVPHDTKWIRDFGPTVLRGSGEVSIIVDWQYEIGRPKDDNMPVLLAASSQTPLEPAPLVLEGGNLLSNGCGLLLTTTALLERNAPWTETQVLGTLRNQLYAQQVVFLEPLVGEPTGHVDMFAAFTAANTVVVGQYTQDEDAENAAVLDRNAARLAAVVTPQGPMRVVRIPMGTKFDGLWRTYTNCVFANGVLLVPAFRGHDGQRLEQALNVYRRLLPKWQTVTVDATELILECGALHCASLNIPRLVRPISIMAPPAEVALPLLATERNAAR